MPAKAKRKQGKKSQSAPGANPMLDVIQESSDDERKREEKVREQMIDNKSIRSVPISSVLPDPEQPRKNIDPESETIKELAASIKKHGFINFITVREGEKGQYIIVAGERRYTAAKVAGLEEIPVMVAAEGRDPVDYALIQMEENLQRQDLSPLEELEGYNRLIQDFGLKQRAIVGLIKKSESYLSKMLGLNALSRKIKDDIINWKMAVARDILWEVAGYSEEDQEYIWKRIREKPVRSVLNKVKDKLAAKKGKKKRKKDATGYEASEVWEALKQAVSKDKDRIFEFITPKKVEKLLEEFRKKGNL